MAQLQISIQDLVADPTLRRRVRRFVQLCCLALDRKREAHKEVYLTRAEQIIRNIFGWTEDTFRIRNALINLREKCILMLNIAWEAIRRPSAPPPQEIAWLTIHASMLA